MGTYLTQGLILKHQDYRETDRLITIYSREYGKITALARGSRKISSKLAGSLEPFILADLMIARGRHFDTIASLEVIKNFRLLKKSLGKIYLADYFSTVVSNSSKGRQRDPRIFELLQEVFFWLETEFFVGSKKQLIIWYFVWQYLTYLGYQPELYHCLIGGEKISPKKNYFSFRKGGLVCQKCLLKDEQAISISENAIKILRLIVLRKRRDLGKIKINKSLIVEIDKLTGDFLNYTQEQELRLEKFLKPL
jgi:DNA repair protein RecO (recombination protein O)